MDSAQLKRKLPFFSVGVEDVLWTEKYQPQDSSELVGNKKEIERLHRLVVLNYFTLWVGCVWLLLCIIPEKLQKQISS